MILKIQVSCGKSESIIHRDGQASQVVLLLMDGLLDRDICYTKVTLQFTCSYHEYDLWENLYLWNTAQ